jgi:ATP-dependent DNA helicase RecG
MREEELILLVRKIQQRRSEFQNVELKSAETDFPKRIYDTLSSFSNQDDGGVIVFGISEKDNYNIVGVYDLEKAQRRAMEACEQMEPAVRAVFSSAEMDGKYVLAAEIPSVEYWLRPVFYKGAGRLKGSYVRVGDADEPMTEYEVYSFESFRRRSRDELRTVPECRMDMLDPDRLGNYLLSVKRERGKLSKISDSEILELMGISVKGVPTLAGVLSFSLYPQTWFSQLCITAVSVPGTEIGDTEQDGSRFLDNKRITGAIPEMLDIDGDNPCGLCVPPKDVQALKWAIEKMLNDADFSHKCGDKAKGRVRSLYTMQKVWTTCLSRYLADVCIASTTPSVSRKT